MEANKNTENFKASNEIFMGYKHPEVIKHWPPQYIISKVYGQAKIIDVYKHELMSVNLVEISNDWNYSNPTFKFNLSVAHKAVKISEYGF